MSCSCGTTVCRPVRRLPNISAYTFRVAPSETCHPARILRDLHISARLILKLGTLDRVKKAFFSHPSSNMLIDIADKAFGVSELMGGNSDTAEVSLHHFDNDNSACVSASTGDGGHQLKTLDDMASFETVCSRHPVLADLCNVLRQHSGWVFSDSSVHLYGSNACTYFVMSVYVDAALKSSLTYSCYIYVLLTMCVIIPDGYVLSVVTSKETFGRTEKEVSIERGKTDCYLCSGWCVNVFLRGSIPNASYGIPLVCITFGQQ